MLRNVFIVYPQIPFGQRVERKFPAVGSCLIFLDLLLILSSASLCVPFLLLLYAAINLFFLLSLTPQLISPPLLIQFYFLSTTHFPSIVVSPPLCLSTSDPSFRSSSHSHVHLLSPLCFLNNLSLILHLIPPPLNPGHLL